MSHRHQHNRFGLPTLPPTSFDRIAEFVARRKAADAEDLENETAELVSKHAAHDEVFQDPNTCHDCGAPIVRVASARDVPEGFTRIASGFYRAGHAIWELRADDHEESGYFLVRKHEEPAVDLRKSASKQAQVVVMINPQQGQSQQPIGPPVEMATPEDLMPKSCPTCGHSMSCDCRGFEPDSDTHGGEEQHLQEEGSAVMHDEPEYDFGTEQSSASDSDSDSDDDSSSDDEDETGGFGNFPEGRLFELVREFSPILAGGLVSVVPHHQRQAQVFDPFRPFQPSLGQQAPVDPNGEHRHLYQVTSGEGNAIRLDPVDDVGEPLWVTPQELEAYFLDRSEAFAGTSTEGSDPTITPARRDYITAPTLPTGATDPADVESAYYAHQRTRDEEDESDRPIGMPGPWVGFGDEGQEHWAPGVFRREERLKQEEEERERIRQERNRLRRQKYQQDPGNSTKG